MPIVFLVPDIRDVPTGGNVYNRRVMAEMEAPVEAVSWSVEEVPQGPFDFSDRLRDEGGVVVVDSLLVRHGEALRAVRAAHPEARLVLLTHYLHCVDPTASDPGAAEAERAVLSLFDGAVTPSAHVRDALCAEGMVPETVVAVPPGLDDRFRASHPDERSSDAGPAKMLTVANLLPGKGLPDLLDALEMLPEDRPWTWTLVGSDALDPDFAASFRERVAASPVADRVTLAGTVPADEMPATYDAHDVAIVPSRFETCSMTTREAMARGMAVVACAVGGLPENLRPPDAPRSADAPLAGRLVEPGDPGALAEALRDVLTDADLRATLGRAAWARSQAFPSWTETARQFEASVTGRREA